MELNSVNNSKQKGDFAEELCCKYLQDRGFSIVEKNFYAKKLGEIDIIAFKDGIYHFCEVKSASNYETAINNMNYSKLSKLKRSVEYYIQTKKVEKPYLIDAMIVVEYEIEFLENITI